MQRGKCAECGCPIPFRYFFVELLTALWLAELMTEAGVPEGVLNVVTGGIEAGDALLRHKDVDKIAAFLQRVAAS